ncbi:hypothetical protein [Parachryseolinea silvisoli]|uniref:hypothetical protein n=1 Tax=Parachryseolinea silvisoli TaxID=2873601 RepID=UPI002265D115|nr:hypothetical protein [Parachryseolinea silvisoli]MCD9015477.1 hypothetical protein [Parachryseolinea silvisoli]
MPRAGTSGISAIFESLENTIYALVFRLLAFDFEYACYNKCRGMLCRRLTIACLVLLPAISLNAQNVSKLKATKHVGDSIARSITHPRVADSIPASILGESSTGNAVIKKGQKVQSGLRKGLDSLGGSATSTENVVQDRIRKERNTLDSLERIAKSPLDSLQERVGNLKEKWAGKVDVDSIERVSERLQPLAIPSLDNVRPRSIFLTATV